MRLNRELINAMGKNHKNAGWEIKAEWGIIILKGVVKANHNPHMNGGNKQ
jgi:hypothetical protein